MDYRQSSCSASSSNVMFFGGCSQQASQGYRVHTSHNTTSPVPLPKGGDGDGTGLCDCTELYETFATGSNWSSAFHGPMEQWQGSPSDMLTVQTFALGSDLVISDCQKPVGGFKNVAARRQWHGIFGFDDNDNCEHLTSIAPQQSKYTQVSLACTFDYQINETAYYYDSATDSFIAPEAHVYSHDSISISGGMSVNPTTGIRSNGTSITEDRYDYIACDGLTAYLTHTKHMVNGAGWVLDPACTASNYSYGLGTDIDYLLGGAPNCHTNIPYIDVFIAGGFDWTDGKGIWFHSDWGGDSNSGGIHISDMNYYFQKPDGSWQEVYTGGTVDISMSRTADSYTWSIQLNYMNIYYSNINYNFSGTYSYGSANSASSVLADAEGMLGSWNLTDNKIYPWRSDNWTSYMPLMARREVQFNVSPFPLEYQTVQDFSAPVYSGSAIIGYGGRAWFDPNDKWWKWVVGHENEIASSLESTHMDGTVLGSPFTPTISGSASIAYGWFDFYGDYIKYCPQPTGYDCVGPNWEQWTYQQGGTLADMNISNSGTEDGGQLANILPMCSTHWVNNEQAHSLAKGALQKCSIGDDAIWSVKWANTRQPVNSENFFRPCGSDRVLIDETTAVNFTDGLTMDGSLVGLSGGSSVLVYNGSNNGIYTGCSQSDNGDGTFTLTLGSMTANLPTDFTRPLEGNVAGFIRFPTAWPICGRDIVSVTGSATASVVTFNSPQTNLRTADKINLYSTAYSLTAATQSVTRVNDTTFTLATPYSGSMTGSYYASSYGSPDYHWNDTTPKSEFRYNSWTVNNRLGITTSGSCVTDCVPYTPCDYQVICFSPNGETFPNGKTMWFATGSFVADGYYGSMQQIYGEFEMTDPLFQTPLAPIVSDLFDDPSYATIIPEDGTCPENTFDPLTGKPILYYQIPKVEALCGVPSGAPALPSGLTVTTIQQPPLAGVVGYSFHTYSEPWNYHANSLEHCEDGCRFAYIACK